MPKLCLNYNEVPQSYLKHSGSLTKNNYIANITLERERESNSYNIFEFNVEKYIRNTN